MSKFVFILFMPLTLFAQGIAINSSGGAPDSSEILDLSSTTKGFLPPRLTSPQRDAILNPATGLLVFNMETGCLNYFASGSWNVLCGSPAGSVSSLKCNSANLTGSLTSGTAASGVSSSVPYTGGNGGSHSGQVVTSTGVNGLTASLTAGNFALGNLGISSFFFFANSVAGTKIINTNKELRTLFLKGN